VTARICKIALDTPLRRLFDYLVHETESPLQPGVRVAVPFGRQQLVGVVVRLADESDLPDAKLRRVQQVLDAQPLFSDNDLALLEWAAAYYHHPVGSVFAAALPRLLRQTQDPRELRSRWAVTPAGLEALEQDRLRRAPRQRTVLKLLQEAGPCDSAAMDLREKNWRGAARELIARGYAACEEVVVDEYTATESPAPAEVVPQLTDAQADAVRAVRELPGGRGTCLLDGVTGSGKTEVYLRIVADVLARGESALVLCPEIGLTPQLVQRFEQRFGTGIASLHSGLTDRERALAWQSAARGRARIVIGTRSAVFTPIPRLGLIVIDEEHDASYKQQEGGFRYSARDLALLRAQRLGIPAVLGSATPSFESLHNVAQGKIRHLLLPGRAGGAAPPRLAIVDMRAHAMHKGFSAPLLLSMQRHLDAGNQVLLYINRRGYAPTLLCSSCGWIAPCRSCDARMTVHQRARRLACHHCGDESPLPERCPRCGYEVHPLGHGTERVEETLAERFPDHAIERFDRDVLREQRALEGAISRVHSGKARILVGTQMLAKGHHFPDVTLVGMLNADQSLFSTDFRAAERLAQTIVQVAGRAGRADRVGEVLIQSQYPDHPLLTVLLEQGYGGFAASAMQERAAAHWPPFARMAILRASSPTPDAALQFLRSALQCGGAHHGVDLRGPVPAAMLRRAGRYYAQLLVESVQRTWLQAFLTEWIPAVEELPRRGDLRWALDVDPLEVI
jgi:primosomal protein N' (replication factor Y) (superfamily II helicase)